MLDSIKEKYSELKENIRSKNLEIRTKFPKLDDFMCSIGPIYHINSSAYHVGSSGKKYEASWDDKGRLSELIFE